MSPQNEIRHNNLKILLKKYKQNTKHFTISFKDTKKLVSRNSYMINIFRKSKCKILTVALQKHLQKCNQNTKYFTCDFKGIKKWCREIVI